ncbi:hypothetical protein [Algivirga pacifica]|uniref:Bacterial surface antigen (D15) domain-containing protein n=1 Tax=Algivirga pacifica TaxID=1162670 RepID=A0ABP9DQ36_9BACT
MQWQLYGNGASLAPALTFSQGFGIGRDVGWSLSFSTSYYIGPMGDLDRNRMETISITSKRLYPPTYFHSSSLGIPTLSSTFQFDTKNYIHTSSVDVIGTSLLDGGTSGVSNTFLIYDFYNNSN